MYSFTVTHESRNLKQARSKDQYVDLLHMGYCACYSLISFIISQQRGYVNGQIHFFVSVCRQVGFDIIWAPLKIHRAASGEGFSEVPIFDCD